MRAAREAFETALLAQRVADRFATVGGSLPGWAQSAGFRGHHGDYKLWSTTFEYIYYLTPNKGRYRLQLDPKTKKLALPPDSAKAGPGFTTDGPFHPGMMFGPNRHLYNLAVKIDHPDEDWGGWKVHWSLRPSDAVGYNLGLRQQDFDTAEAVIKVLNKHNSEAAVGRFLAQFVGRRPSPVK